MNDSQGAVADPLDSRCNLELEPISPWDDETYRRHQTYNPQSSYNIGIQVVLVSQERRYLFAMDNILQELSRSDSQNMFQEM